MKQVIKQTYGEVPVFASVRDTAKHTGLSTCYLYKLVREGKIKHTKIGEKYMIHVESLIDDAMNGRLE